MVEITEGSLRVWWIPQVLMPLFSVPVKNTEEAMLILDTLARYDMFQYRYNIKPDYSNAGGLDIFERGEWSTWYGKDGRDIDELMRERGLKV